jgi:hypothetical protein
MWEVGLPCLLWSFLPTATFTSCPAPGCCWACTSAPAFSSWLVVRDFPSPPLRCSGCPALFAMCLYVVIAYYSVFFLFSLGGGQSVQGAMLIWPRIVCGSTACRLAHLVVCVFPSRLAAAVWRWRGSPPQLNSLLGTVFNFLIVYIQNIDKPLVSGQNFGMYSPSLSCHLKNKAS